MIVIVYKLSSTVMIIGVIAFFAAGFLLSLLNPFAATPSISSDEGNEINLDQNHRSLRLGYLDPKTVTRKVVPATFPENKNAAVECPSLHSTAIQLANSVKFDLNSISETAIGRGLVAGSCKPSGWSYSLVFPKFDRRGQGWMSEGYKSIMGEGLVPLCGYDWNEMLHRVFMNDSCDLVVDVGANFGLAVLPAVAKQFRVLAFEPIPLNLEVLQTNIWVNGWDVDTVGIVPAGVSESSGSTTIYVPMNAEDNSAIGNDASVATRNVGGSAIPIPIQLVSIDEYFNKADSTLLDTVRLFKIDVQGHELQVLRGMETLLSAGDRRFVLFVEVDTELQQAAGHGPKDIEEYMLSLGWNAYCIRKSGIKLGSDCYDVVFIHESRVSEARMT